MSDEDRAHKLQIAADLIHEEAKRHGNVVPMADCFAIARRLWDIWHDRHDIRNLTPGEVAQRFRRRYIGNDVIGD